MMYLYWILVSVYAVITTLIAMLITPVAVLFANTAGMPYDWRGALATRLPGSQDGAAWFCNEWVAQPYLMAAGTFSPHHLAAICMSIGRDVTAEFFGKRREGQHDR